MLFLSPINLIAWGATAQCSLAFCDAKSDDGTTSVIMYICFSKLNGTPDQSLENTW